MFHRKMKHLLLTFALFMLKQDYYYCSGYVSQVLQNPKTCRPRLYWMINYEQTWFKKTIARKDETIFQEQKQPPEVFFKKRCSLETSQNSQESTCARASFLIKSQVLPWACNFPVNFEKFLRTHFLQNTSGQRKNEFRMLPSTFDLIVSLVEADMKKEDTYFRKIISIQKRVACALWRLSTGNS